MPNLRTMTSDELYREGEKVIATVEMLVRRVTSLEEKEARLLDVLLRTAQKVSAQTGDDSILKELRELHR